MAHWINGALEKGGGEVLEVVNPFTEEVIERLSCASGEDVASAVAAASAALEPWSAKSGEERAGVLEAIAAGVEKAKEELSKSETENCGKPIEESKWDLDDVAGCFKYYAGLARDLDTKQNTAVDVGDADYECLLRYEAAGVAGLIVPFNYPLLMIVWKAAAAMAAGCSVVVKPSENTPLTALKLAQVCKDAGLPDGVFNVVNGRGNVGQAIVEHKDVAVVSFTGSVPTGIKVMQASAPLVKGVGLELGGKSTAIVFPDCDLKQAAEWVAFGCFWTNGQICSSTSRLIVMDSIYDKFVEMVKQIGKDIKMGDPMEEDCRLGPIVTASQRDKVLDFVQTGIKEGATLLLGSGKKPERKGFFVEPTIFEVKDQNSTTWNEEIFGPVLSVMRFTSDDEALAIANNSKYGLAAAVFSADKKRLTKFNQGLKVGIVWNNCSQPCFCQLPWGGPGLSGNGSRDLGEFGMSKYLEPKQIVVYKSENPLGWYDVSNVN